MLHACTDEPRQKNDDLTAFTARWDSTTTRVTDQVTRIIKAQEEAQELLEAVDTLSSGSAMKTQLEEQMQGLGAASEASFDFVNRWQEGASTLNTLKEAQSKPISPETLAQLRQLEEEGQNQADAWATQLLQAEQTFREARELLE
jgi:predicted trehalose synthase